MSSIWDWLGHSEIQTTERYAKLRPVPIARILGQGKRGDGRWLKSEPKSPLFPDTFGGGGGIEDPI